MNSTTKIHHSVGVYSDLSYKQNGVAEEHLAEHINYNKKYRFGRALFVDGVCVYEGYLIAESLEKAKQIVMGITPITKDTQPYQ
jgi:hypothetical protein